MPRLKQRLPLKEDYMKKRKIRLLTSKNTSDLALLNKNMLPCWDIIQLDLQRKIKLALKLDGHRTLMFLTIPIIKSC